MRVSPTPSIGLSVFFLLVVPIERNYFLLSCFGVERESVCGVKDVKMEALKLWVMFCG